MTPEQVARAAILVRALDVLPELAEESLLDEPRNENYERRVCEIGFADASGAGSEPSATLELDPQTGRLLLARLETIIRGELVALGVELPIGT